MQWKVEAAEEEGCQLVTDPCQARPKCSLMDEACPTLMLLDELSANWTAVGETVIHTDITVKIFDGRGLDSKKLYLQTLLSLEDKLPAQEDGGIMSAQPQSYYRLVHMKKKVAAGLGDHYYKFCLKAVKSQPSLLELPAFADVPAPRPKAKAKMLHDIFDVAEGFDMLEDQAPKPRRRKRARANLAASLPAPSAMPALPAPGDHDAAPLPAPSAMPPLPPPLESPAASSSSSSSSSSDSDAEGHVSKLYNLGVGPLIKLDVYKRAGGDEYRRYIALCPKSCKHGVGCQKKRSTLLTEPHGNITPLAYLCAWAELGVSCSRQEHTRRNFVVPPEAIARWAEQIPIDRAQPLIDLALKPS